MRETKFRGLTNSGKWVYGCLVYTENISPAIYSEIGEGSVKELHWVYVKKESVGEFTGLKDKNGKEIYEGDIINVFHGMNNLKVVMVKGCWCASGGEWEKPGVSKEKDASELYLWAKNSELIGNIHENIELLK